MSKIQKAKNQRKINNPFVMMDTLYFTEEEKDVVSQDFHLEKQIIKKKKTRRKKQSELEKPDSDIEKSLTLEQQSILKKNSIVNERILAIEKILEMYPNLRKDRKIIVDCVLGKKEVIKKEYVLEKLNVKGKNIYKDDLGNIINENVDLVGFWLPDKDESGKSKINYLFFNETKKIRAKIMRNKKKVENMVYK
jgi:hypothetical protein